MDVSKYDKYRKDYVGELKIERMNKEELIYWRDRYNATNSGEDERIERVVGESLRKNGKLSRNELEEIIRWKMANAPGRMVANLKRVRTHTEDFVELITKTALKSKDDKERIKILTTLNGVGVAVASAILSFYDPNNYGVGDRYIMDAFSSRKTVPTTTDYLNIFKILREEKERHHLGVRDIEKAYYQKYIEKR